MDVKSVAFCRVSRDLHLEVTKMVPLWKVFEKGKAVVLARGGEAMLRFLTGSAIDRGYVPVNLFIAFSNSYFLLRSSGFTPHDNFRKVL